MGSTLLPLADAFNCATAGTGAGTIGCEDVCPAGGNGGDAAAGTGCAGTAGDFDDSPGGDPREMAPFAVE